MAEALTLATDKAAFDAFLRDTYYLYVYKFGPGRYWPSVGHTRRAGGASEGQQRRELTATASAWQSRVLGVEVPAGCPAGLGGAEATATACACRGRQLATRRDAGAVWRVHGGPV